MLIRFVSVRAAVLATSMLAGSAAFAQDVAAPSADVAATEDTSGITDIVVTAQRRAESLQKVPIAVSAIDASGLAKAGITSTDALSAVTPGLQLNLQRNSLTPYLRGVGTQNGGGGEEGSIATYVDGVYIAALTGSTLALNNIERVEVLKGPQGTLFGRNATGGLIHVITRDPSHEPMARGSVGYSNYNTWTAQGYATAGLTDTIAMDVAGYFTDQGKGWGKNISGVAGVNGQDVNYRDEWAVRSKLLFTPTDELRVTLSGDYAKRESDIGNTRAVYPGAVIAGGTPFRGTIFDTQSNLPRGVNFKQYGGSAKIEYETAGPTITSTTAYRKYENFTRFDQDASPLNIVDAPITDKALSFQQELLLVGDIGNLDYTTGLFYYYSRANTKLDFTNTPSQRRVRLSQMKTHSYAAFAQGTYHFGEATSFTAGLRYTKDKREMRGIDLATNLYGGAIVGPSPQGNVISSSQSSPNPDEKTYNKLTWRFAFDQQITDRVLAYASYSRGFKSGIFNTTVPTDAPVNPETLDAYEVGLKSDLIDRTLRVNLSGFYYKYKDIQLTSIQAGTTALFNAAEAEVKGGEIELIAAPPVAEGNLEFRAAASYLHGRYKFFPTAQRTTRNPAGGNISTTFNAAGNDMIRTPPFTLNLSGDYTIPVGEAGDLGFNVTYYYNSGFYFEPDNRIRQENYNLLNASISFTAPDDRWSVRGWVSNLTDQEYYSGFSQSSLGDQVSPGAPRTYGVTLGFKFGG